MKKTAVMATGRLCTTWYQLWSPHRNSGGTNEYSEIKRTRLEVVFEDEPRCNWDRICDIKPGDRQCEDGTDSLISCKREKAEEDGYRSGKPHGIDGGTGETVHAV